MPDTKDLFNKISKYYDLLNTIFSVGIDKKWRIKLVSQVAAGSTVLDVATGTAEVISEGIKKDIFTKSIGLDPSIEMLKIGNKKLNTNFYKSSFLLIEGTAENLPFDNNSFDATTIAFGIRNTINYHRSLQEMFRVIKPGGKIAILEFAIPTYPFIRQLYLLYFKYLMPHVGSIFGSKKEYKYLSESTLKFPQRLKFLDVLRDSGFVNCEFEELSLGIAIIYTGLKT
ncbi:MAG: ubiquinone/menaquinone biosynthesis methyltransferase [Thermodesulfobacteriota bacterium]